MVAFPVKQFLGVSEILALDPCPARWVAPKNTFADRCVHIGAGKCRPWPGTSSFCSGARGPTSSGGAGVGVCPSALVRRACGTGDTLRVSIWEEVRRVPILGTAAVAAPLGRSHRSTPGNSQQTRGKLRLGPVALRGFCDLEREERAFGAATSGQGSSRTRWCHTTLGR